MSGSGENRCDGKKLKSSHNATKDRESDNRLRSSESDLNKKQTRAESRDVSSKTPPFAPREHPLPRVLLPDELWIAVLECSCTFPSEIFDTVMLNLIKNPNVTSSHLFRADIFYDSENNASFPLDGQQEHEAGLLPHLKAEYQPRPAAAQWPGFRLERTIVRQLIPRNPQLDRALVQTCHFFQRRYDSGNDRPGKESQGEEAEGEGAQNLVLYIPHVSDPSEIPFYHPYLSQLAFVYTTASASSSSHLTILYRPFTLPPLPTKLTRTALHLLSTIHKHGQGALAGYTKRVHLDTIIPQKTYQDTYTRLKATYARHLSQAWVEVTDPGKHVFEDLGIAAYLIELWRIMYGDEEDDTNRSKFPGFVDIGCGNGVLVYLLVMEGYEGWGFDARARKTWGIFPEHVQARLQQRVLVPSVLRPESDKNGATYPGQERWHDGHFPLGTFIVSNHADELTPWTPLLASLNDSPFLAIPCCSHDFSGARFRAPATTRAPKDAPRRLPQHEHAATAGGQAAETGSLKRTDAQKKMPSAYATLCAYVAAVAGEVGFDPETDVLRIPSTRNSCILGRRRNGDVGGAGEDRMACVRGLIERELRRDIASVAAAWVERAEKLSVKPDSGH